MTALAANKERRTRNAHLMRVGAGTGADSSEFYEGAMVAHNNAGKIARAADTANFKIAGIARKRTTTGSSNTTKIEFEFGHEEWTICDATVVNGGIGLDGVILDDGTVTNAATATNDIRIGKITELETYKGVTGCWVQVGVLSTAAAA